jgi:osmotically-inducible protein OsmY
MLNIEERVMAQHYRNQSGRPGESRGGRYQGGSERDRYRTGGEQQHSGGDWYNRSRGVTDDRSAGGYSEEFGHQRGRNRDESDQDVGGRYQSRGSSGANYQGDRSHGGDYDREGQSRFDQGRFDEGNRWEGSGQRDYGSEDFYSRNQGTSTGRWQEDENDQGGYFGTGSYVDDGDSSRGLQRDFYRARAQQERDIGSYRDRGSTGAYGQSYYGSQSNYGRGQGDESRQWRSQQGDENRNRNYGGQSIGSGGSGGTYGRDPQSSGRNYGQGSGQNYGQSYSSSGTSQSFRGRGPQGYQRSDERLKEMICERLTDDPHIDASNITIEVTGQIVKLTGSVDDRGTKYEIEELVERMGGVKDIDNQLRVQSGRSESQQSSGSQSAGSQSAGQQQRGGSDWEAGSSSTNATSGRTGTSSGASTSGSPTSGSTTKRN